MLEEGQIKGTNIKLQIVADKAAISEHFARTMSDIIGTNNSLGRPSRFIMPVGPTGQYRIFADICNKERLDLSLLHMFNMDEYVGDDGSNLPDSHPLSFSRFLCANFYNVIDARCGLNLNQMHIPDAKHPAAHGKAIEDAGGIDICFGGIGINGHIAFNEAVQSCEQVSNEDFKNTSTRVIRLSTTTKVINAVFGAGGDIEAVPDFAVTVGMKEILASEKIFIYLDWFWQKQVLRKTIFGPITAEFPASFLQQHPDVTITVSREIAEEQSMQPE